MPGTKARGAELTARDVAKNRQQDVDQEISTASALEEDTERRKDDGKNDLADIAGRKVSYARTFEYEPWWSFLPGCERHVGSCVGLKCSWVVKRLGFARVEG